MNEGSADGDVIVGSKLMREGAHAVAGPHVVRLGGIENRDSPKNLHFAGV